MYVKETKVPCCFGFCYSADLEPMECVTINGNSVYVNDQIELEKIERRDANNRTICSYKPNEHSHDRSNWVLQQETPASEYNLLVFYIIPAWLQFVFFIWNPKLIRIFACIFQILSQKKRTRHQRYSKYY